MSLHVVEPGGRSAVFHRGDRLRKSRESAGIQVQQMATLLGVKRGAITRYEDNIGVRTMIVEAYAKHTGFDADWIEHGDDPDGDGGQRVTWAGSGRYWSDTEDEYATELVAA